MELSSISYRLLGPGDEALFERVAPGVFDGPPQALLVREFLNDPRHHIVVAVDGETVVGFVSGVDYVHPDKPRAMWVNEVSVAESYRRRGIATRALLEFLNHARTIECREAWLGTETNNVAATRLYRAVGGHDDPPDGSWAIVVWTL